MFVSASVTVTVNTITIAISAPAANATVFGSVPLTTTVAGNVDKVEFYDGTTKIGEDSTYPFSLSWDTASLPNGNRTLTASWFWWYVTRPFLGMALALIFYAVVLNVGRVSQIKTITTIASNTSASLLATQMAMLATFLPAYLLSGFMFAIGVMPKVLQVLTYLVPARYFLVVTRGIFLKGVGIEVLRIEALLMIAFATVGLMLAIRVFKKEIG